MNLERLKELTKQLIADYPQHTEELVDLYQLAVDEIDEGGSEAHECELAFSDMKCTIED